MSQAPVLGLRGIHKVVDTHFALEGIDLDVRAGEVHFITGENGSGKSLLMRIAAGLDTPDRGEILYRGASVSFASLHEARQRGILYQQQDIELFPNLTVAENLLFSTLQDPRHLAPPLHELVRRARAILEPLDLDLDPEQAAGELGFAQRLLVAALATYAAARDVVIFDEPSAGMGHDDQAVLFRIIKALQARGVAVFYISHRLDEMAPLASRITVLQQGRVSGHTEQGAPDRAEVIRMMVGTNRPERYPRLDTVRGPRVLEVRNLASPPALRDVSLSLHQGEILGVMGLMGSGRTRLAHCIIGHHQAAGGSVLLDGQAIRIRHPGDAIRLGVAMLPEDRLHDSVFLRQSIFHNLDLPSLERFMSPRGLDWAYMQELGTEYLDAFAVSPRSLEAPIDTCSGGNQQKVVFARWLMTRARVLILDEPCRGIDAAAKVDLYNAMANAVSHGAAILLISSDVEELMGMADRIVVLAEGTMSHEFSRRDYSKSAILDAASPREV